MGSVKAGKFQTAICTIVGFFGCKWILLEVIFALLSQKQASGREICPFIAGWTGAHEGY